MINAKKLRTSTREEWLAVRRTGITGTDIAAIMGQSTYASPLSVYLDKVDQPGPDKGNEAMWLGTELEDPIAKLWQKRTGAKIKKVNAVLQHPKYPWMLGNLDRHIIMPREGILEVKLVGPGNIRKWEGGVIPPNFYCQVMWYMAVTGLPYAMIVGLLGGVELVERPLEYDKDVGEALIETAHNFWHNNVLLGVPPAIDGSEATTDAINRMFASRQPVMIQVPEAYGWIQQYHLADENVKLWEGRLDEAKNNIRFLMGNAETGTCGEYRITCKGQTRTTVDATRLKAELPHIYEQYSKKSDTKPSLTIKKEK